MGCALSNLQSSGQESNIASVKNVALDSQQTVSTQPATPSAKVAAQEAADAFNGEALVHADTDSGQFGEQPHIGEAPRYNSFDRPTKSALRRSEDSLLRRASVSSDSGCQIRFKLDRHAPEAGTS